MRAPEVAAVYTCAAQRRGALGSRVRGALRVRHGTCTIRSTHDCAVSRAASQGADGMTAARADSSVTVTVTDHHDCGSGRLLSGTVPAAQ